MNSFCQYQSCFRSVVLNLDLIESQWFGESVSGVRRQEILSNESKINKIHDAHFTFPSTKGSMNAYMELVGFSTSNKVKNHCNLDLQFNRNLSQSGGILDKSGITASESVQKETESLQAYKAPLTTDALRTDKCMYMSYVRWSQS